MKVAIISDIHGNMHALEAALEDVARFKPDHLICAGDVPNPFLRSRDAWLKLKAMGIPILRGNHEDYIVSYFAGDRPEIRESAQFLPVQLVARHLGPEIAREFATLPFSHTLTGPRVGSSATSSTSTDDLYICHASPQHNARSYLRGVDDEMAPFFGPISARTIVAGHIHQQWSQEWQGRRLVIAGSVGLPHHGKPEAEYLRLEHRGGQWQSEFRTVPYDVEAALREYRDSGALKDGGPVAQLLYEEIEHAEPRLAYLLPKILSAPGPKPRTVKEWEIALKRCPTPF